MEFELNQAKYGSPHHVEVLTLDLPVPDADFHAIPKPVTWNRRRPISMTTAWIPETGFPHPHHTENYSRIRFDRIDRGAHQFLFKDHQVLVEDGVLTPPGINGPDGMHDRRMVTSPEVSAYFLETETSVFSRKIHANLSWKRDGLVPSLGKKIREFQVVVVGNRFEIRSPIAFFASERSILTLLITESP
jgi:hypothetical protein